MTLLIQHDLHQVNGLASQLAKEYSTPVNKTMPFSYPRVHSSSGTELISQITKANNNCISSNSNITINTVIPNGTKICQITIYHTTRVKSRQYHQGSIRPQQSRHFSVAVYSSLYDLSIKP